MILDSHPRPSNPLIDLLIGQAVNRLKKFGFVNVNRDNISTDEVYKQYFAKILRERLGEYQELDLAINQLLTDMNLKTERSS